MRAKTIQLSVNWCRSRRSRRQDTASTRHLRTRSQSIPFLDARVNSLRSTDVAHAHTVGPISLLLLMRARTHRIITAHVDADALAGSLKELFGFSGCEGVAVGRGRVVSGEVGRGPSGSEATKQTVTERPRRWLSLRRAVWSLVATARASTRCSHAQRARVGRRLARP